MNLHLLCRLLTIFAVVTASAFAQEVLVPLRSGDYVDIRLGGVPAEDTAAISNSYLIDTDGNINLPHIGKVRAAGSDQGRLQTSIEQAYKTQQIFTNPTITINIPKTSLFVNVDGAVRSRMRVQYTTDMTMLSAINAAGGFNDYANPKKTQLIRDGKSSIIDLREIRQKPELDFPVKPGDKIFVPESFF